MWCKRAHTIDPLTKLCSTKVILKYTDVKNYFIEMKKILVRDILLSYPNFSAEFIIHMDDSKMQHWGVMIQDGSPIAF